MLEGLAPGAACHRVKPAVADAALPGGEALAGYGGAFPTGSPLHPHQETPEMRREVAFMRAVFASGTPAFGS